MSDVRAVAKSALLQLLEPLAGFVSDAGLSTTELHALFREAAVRSAAARQLEVSDRVNISGIAATTGIPRGPISRILKQRDAAAEPESDTAQRSTNRILAAWHEDPKFTDAQGQPADLRVYGRGASFDALAKKHGRGIPTRAVLDELVRGGTVEVLASQKIRAKAYLAVERGMSPRVIQGFGERGAALLTTLLHNMRQPESPIFIASIAEASVSSGALRLFRRELAVKGEHFMAEVGETLTRRPGARSSKREGGGTAISVTVFCHETVAKRPPGSGPKRRNFRREP